MALPAKIGVYESEKTAPQTVILNVSFDFDSAKAAQTDVLEDTIDYAQIEALLREVCLSDHFALLEKLQAVLKVKVAQQFPQISNLAIVIEKKPFESGSIEIR